MERTVRSYPLDGRFGRMPLSALGRFPGPLAARLGREPALETCRADEIAYFDTETTGLGGAGTKIFLAGVGWVEGDPPRFTVLQFLLRDYDEEPELLAALVAELARFRAVATYNGKRFDWPLLHERLILNRMRPSLPHAHYDVLHPSRRLWRRVAPDCSLATLERELLGHRRALDVPGDLVPALFFRWLRERDPRILLPVLAHNLEDVVALAALAALNHAVVEPAAGGEAVAADALVDWVSVGRLWEGEGDPARALAAYARAEGGAEARLAAGRLLRRLGRAEEAVSLWRGVAETDEPAHRLAALEELAKFEEWKAKRPAIAFALTESAWRLLGGLSTAPSALRDRFAHRRNRLLRKVDGAVSGGDALAVGSAP